MKSQALAPTYMLRAAPDSRYVLRIERFDTNGKPQHFNPTSSVMEALDLRDGRTLWKYQSNGVIDEDEVSFSRDGKRIAFPESSQQWQAVVLNGTTGQVFKRFQKSRLCALSPDGNRLATSGVGHPAPGRVFLHDLPRSR